VSTSAEEIAAGYEKYDDLPERVLGYPTAFSALRLGAPDVRTVLDYGCGPGKVALRVAEGYGARVHAVDISARMLAIARARRAHPLVAYHLVEGASLRFLPDDSVDAALCCFVFVTVAEADRLREVCAEVHRVLRPGGRFAVLDVNPDATGIRFSTFRTGEPGARYRPGQQRPTWLHLPDGGVLDLADHHWPRSAYRAALAGAGFGDIACAAPLLGGADAPAEAPPGSLLDVERPAEALHPPFLVTSGVK